MILALAVATQHMFHALVPPGLASRLMPLEVGTNAVLLFFTVSGFIVTEAAISFYRERPNSFMANRCLRIYPTYLVALIATALTLEILYFSGSESVVRQAWSFAPPVNGGTFLANLLYVLPGSPALLAKVGEEPILGIAWALQIEMFFYICLWLALIASRHLEISFGLVLVIVGAILLGAYPIALPTWRSGGLQYIPYFVLGCALVFVCASDKANPTAMAFAIVAAIEIPFHVLGGPVAVPEYGYERDNVAQLMLFAAGLGLWLCLLWFSVRRTIPPGLARADRIVGDLTYPLYLIHLLAILCLAWIGVPKGLPGMLLGYIFSLSLAAIVFQIVETRVAAVRRRIRGFDLGQLVTVAARSGVPLTGTAATQRVTPGGSKVREPN